MDATDNGASMTTTEPKLPLMTRIVEVFLRGDVAIMLMIVSLRVGRRGAGG